MPEIPDDLADGDALEPYHLNAIYAELRRLRGLAAAPPLVAEGFDGDGVPFLWDAEPPPFFIQLTATYSDGYAWKEVLIGPGRAVSDANVSGGPATGDPAFERQTGDTTLTADTVVYEARRGFGGVLSFDGKN